MVWNRKTAVAVFVGLPLSVIAAFLIWFTARPEYQGLHPITLRGDRIYVSIADTDALRAQGLGGRSGLRPDEGMLFVFATEGKYAFWMKDMQFAIDMLWLDSNHHIVHIVPGVSPDTYPQAFVSDKPARYVLELPAGYSEAHHVQLGDVADW